MNDKGFTAVAKLSTDKCRFCISFLLGCLFDLMLYVYVKQLWSCWDGQLLLHTVPWQASLKQFTSIKRPFFCQ